MTVSYAGEVPNGSSFGVFWKILLKWRGSVYKLVWRELIAYLCVYLTINLVYRFVLTETQQEVFNKIRLYFSQQGESIPMSFVLGFYVSLVVKRWWEQYRLLPWPDTLALFISAAIPNVTDERLNKKTGQETGRLMRRNIMRYMVLAYVITLQRISLRVKRRFPTTQHLVDAGLMHESEMKIFEALNQKNPMSKYWMPLVWATNIINRARKEGLIASDHIVQTILVELSDIRRRLGGLIGYDTVCVPLVYTQVVTLVLYTYFIAALLGRQMLPNAVDRNGRIEPDLYFPFFTVLQFVFYVGWLKVAEVLINPFGEDDDDIELNWLIDRHIKAAYMIVDEMHEEHPELLRDQYWECVIPDNLPYTVGSEAYRREEPKGSAEKYKVKKEDAMYANIMPNIGKRGISDDVYADYESVDTPITDRRKNNNWLVRQLSRMGSVRSQSTICSSSGGLPFHRNRVNSVYSGPEAGLAIPIEQQSHQAHQADQHHQHQQQPPAQSQSKSLYERFVNRKSYRQQRQLNKQSSKLNLKPRPRIPTPDVAKDEKEPNAANGVIMAPQDLSTGTGTNMYPYTSTNSYQEGGQVLGTLLLSPIKEIDSSSSNNTLIPGHPTTTALAQAVLPTNLTDNFAVPTLPATSHITTLSFPFTVTTTAVDTLPTGTLNILPIATTATQLPTITTTANGYDGKDIITAIPVSLSIRSPSPLSMGESIKDETAMPNTLKGANNTTTTAILAVQTMNGDVHMSRNNSFNTNINLNRAESYILERATSLRSMSTKATDAMDAAGGGTGGISGLPASDGSDSVNCSLDNTEHESTIIINPTTTSAPSTLTKHTPETKTGEVYV